VGLVRGQELSVDGSFVEANAAKESRIPREQLAEAAEVHYAVGQYLQELEQQNPVEEAVHAQEQISTTDPDSTYATKGGTPARLGYYDNYLVDNHSCVIVGVQATAARLSQETVAAQDMIARFSMARAKARVGSCRCHVRQRRVSAVAAASWHHSVHAHTGQRTAQAKPVLWSRALHLSAGKQ